MDFTVTELQRLASDLLMLKPKIKNDNANSEQLDISERHEKVKDKIISEMQQQESRSFPREIEVQAQCSQIISKDKPVSASTKRVEDQIDSGNWNIKTQNPSITTAKGWWQLDEEWKNIFRRLANFTEQPSKHDLMRIKQLNCNNAKIYHLLPLRELNFLKDLNCSNNPIDNLEPLQNTHFLVTLNCSKTQIYSLEPVRELSLKELDCSETQISSLSPLWNMNDLKLLNCRNTQIHKSEIEQFKRRCPQCKVITDFQIDLEIIKPAKSELLSEGRISITTAKGWWQLDEEWKNIFRRIVNFTEQPSNTNCQ